ncbi:hypothetical protein QTA56_06815 [Acinetobacter sp. VNH17]|uniref:DUF1311 domain-containing protein n=1 Tax=Acinetobacter thutiue TaxID=2998078 RepID=A0ABT7WMN1_9GAMM|nr:hypothetical protein [Acinetobacter thutiue]MCY6411849.1 hypothetical protein [Acinetobacter thutiue]MDN0013951.1 hypothetical protein [Acinetobacter thutiue]
MNIKVTTLIFTSSLFLFGCNEVNYAKLNYQAQSCSADNSVSCNDIRVQRAIVATEMAYQQMIDEKDKFVAELGQTGYDQLLNLMKQKIEHLKKQRPGLYLRWFQGDSTYYKEVDFGDRIDVEIEKLINARNAAPVLESTSADLIQDGEPIHVASEQNQPAYSSTKYPYSYTLSVVNPAQELDYGWLLDTATGPLKFDINYTSVAQNSIIRRLKKGDCIHFGAQDVPVMNEEHQLYFETYITDPQIVQCE